MKQVTLSDALAIAMKSSQTLDEPEVKPSPSSLATLIDMMSPT